MSSPKISSPLNYDVEDPFVGKGSYGIVSKIRIKDTKEVYALKTIKLSDCADLIERKELLEQSQAEYRLLKRELPNVVKSYGSCQD